MRTTTRSIVLAFVTLASAVVLGVVSIMGAGLSLAGVSTVTALIMGGSGTPDPDQEVGYVPNVSSYYIYPNSACRPDNCTLQAVVTPEDAWPLYGGPDALTWQQSILKGLEIYDAAVRTQLQTADKKVVIFGYSQSTAILALEKRALADDPTIPPALIDKLQLVAIGNVSRPNGGLNARLPGFTLPIVEFPFGPAMPTDTTIETTDVALKWDIIADAPLYALNLLAMLNALVGGPGFGINHGSYPNPEGDPPAGLVGGYTQAEWQAIMDKPEAYAAAHPDVVTVQKYGDTKYVTVAPKVLPLLVPLHNVGLGLVADLLEPALRVIIEETGYDRSIPYGKPTPFQLVPVFDPIKLALDVIAAIPEGVVQALNGGRPPLTLPETKTTSSLATPSGSADHTVTVDLPNDGMTDPPSESATSNSHATTANRMGAQTGDNASGSMVESSSGDTRVNQVDSAKQDIPNGPETSCEDVAETKQDLPNAPEEIKKDDVDPEEIKKDAVEVNTDRSGSVSLDFSPKKQADGDTGGATAGPDDAGSAESPKGPASEQPAA